MDATLLAADGKVAKYRLKSRTHGDACETVLMQPRPRRATVCVSTQVGCAVGCAFCATGRMGLVRQLKSTEILEQVLIARSHLHASHTSLWRTTQPHRSPKEVRAARPHLRNIVFMGMGEPLHNVNEVSDALAFLLDDQGFGFSPRHVTLSTVGVPEKMVAMAERFPRLRIALSLHAAQRDLRKRLIPRATNDLDALKKAIERINAIDPEGPVWIEYALLRNINDSPTDADALIAFCAGLRVEINVIPYNDISHADDISHAEGIRASDDASAQMVDPWVDPAARFHAPSPQTARSFVQRLRDAGYFTTLRNTLGQSIQAACGQLIAPPGAEKQKTGAS